MLTPIELEKYLIKPSKWDKIPDYILDQLPKDIEEDLRIGNGPPTGIGHTTETGWFVLQTSGQGPYVVWMERK